VAVFFHTETEMRLHKDTALGFDLVTGAGAFYLERIFPGQAADRSSAAFFIAWAQERKLAKALVTSFLQARRTDAKTHDCACLPMV
jgi:hypothetical protein